MTKCEKCGGTNILHKSGEWECMSCGHKWREQASLKELFTGRKLDGFVEAAKVKTLDTFDAEAVVRKEEIPTFTPAMLSLVKQAWETGEFQTFWEWVIEPRTDGVTVRLRGVEKAHEFFPKEIIEGMVYDEEKRVYVVREQ